MLSDERERDQERADSEGVDGMERAEAVLGAPLSMQHDATSQAGSSCSTYGNAFSEASTSGAVVAATGIKGGLSSDDSILSTLMESSWEHSSLRKSFESGSGVAKRLDSLTINKLQFSQLRHLYGRDKELDLLSRHWHAVSVGAAPNLLAEEPRAVAKPGSSPSPKGTRMFVTILGASGTGKSSLAAALRPTVLGLGGFFLQGKFPQQIRPSRKAVEPYAAIISACLDLCSLVISIDDQDGSYKEPFGFRRSFAFKPADLKSALEQELGQDANVLIKVIPGLGQILKPVGSSQGFEGSLGLLETQRQFKFAFRRFMRVVSSYGPVLLLMDDLQWADVASLEIIESLLTDRENARFMVVGCYRDDETYGNMPHLNAIKSIQDRAAEDPGLQFDSLRIGNLEVADVSQLLVDLLSSQPAATLNLAACVHRKTLGNVFFVIQFLELLQDMDLLTFSLGGLKWVFDVHKIQLATSATENVVGLMYSKMKALPNSISRALPIMACLGSSFAASVFELTVRHFKWDDDAATDDNQPDHNECSAEKKSNDETRSEQAGSESAAHRSPRRLEASSALQFCQKQGFIESTGDDRSARYHWLHDKIQEAAFSLRTEEDLNSLKLEIGRILLQRLGEELDSNVFIVANLLNTCSERDPTSLPQQEPLEVAKLFLRAGVKATENAAYDSAKEYLTAGIRILPLKHWEEHYELSLDMFSSAAEAHFCSGDFDEMALYCDTVIKQENRPILDKKRVYMVLIDATGASGSQGQLDAQRLCGGILSKLGQSFPNRAVTLHALAGIFKVKSTLKKATSQELLTTLQTMDSTSQWAMALLDKYFTWCYINNSNHLPLAVFKGLHLTMKKGLSTYSPSMFALVGLLLSGVLFDFKGGTAFAEQALEMLKQLNDSRKVEPRVIFLCHAFVFCWTKPIALSAKPLLAGYQLELSTGDTESAAWCVCFYLDHCLHLGMTLERLESDCSFYAQQLREVNMNRILTVMKNTWQAVLFLTGANSFDGSFAGDVVHEERDLAAAGDFRYQLFLSIYRFLMYVQFLLGRHNLVYESIKTTAMDKCSYEKANPSISGIYYLYAFNGLSMIALYRETKGRKYLRMARKFAAKIKRWALGENPNVIHFDALLGAEIDSLRGATLSASKSYELAILYAGRRGLIRDRAMAHELFGEHLLRLGVAEHAQDAEIQLGEAIKLYGEWGAHAKVQIIYERHKDVLALPGKIQIDIPWLGQIDSAP